MVLYVTAGLHMWSTDMYGHYNGNGASYVTMTIGM